MASNTNASSAFNAATYDGSARLSHIHEGLTDHLHFQSHVRLHAITLLPEFVDGPTEAERKSLKKALDIEQRRLELLKELIEMARLNNEEILATLRDKDAGGWGTGGWTQTN